MIKVFIEGKAMKKSHKIIITLTLLMCAIIGFVCLIGFTIGGRFGWLHIIIFACISAVISFLSILFINGSNFTKSNNFIEPFVLLTITITVVFNVMYSGINKLSAANEVIAYDTTIEYTSTGKQLHTDIGFYDKNGNMQEIWDFNQFWTDDESCPEEGATITVEERQGGFGYPVFKMTRVNGRIEK